MPVLLKPLADLELRHRLDAVYRAHVASSYGEGGASASSIGENREVLRLFAKLENDDLRHAVVCLLRAIVGPTD